MAGCHPSVRSDLSSDAAQGLFPGKPRGWAKKLAGGKSGAALRSELNLQGFFSGFFGVGGLTGGGTYGMIRIELNTP